MAYLKELLWYSQVETAKVRIFSNPAEIPVEYLPNSSQKHYSSINLLCKLLYNFLFYTFL
jgi:hypothetical protein